MARIEDCHANRGVSAMNKIKCTGRPGRAVQVRKVWTPGNDSRYAAYNQGLKVCTRYKVFAKGWLRLVLVVGTTTTSRYHSVTFPHRKTVGGGVLFLAIWGRRRFCALLFCQNTSEVSPQENSVHERTRSAGELGL